MRAPHYLMNSEIQSSRATLANQLLGIINWAGSIHVNGQSRDHTTEKPNVIFGTGTLVPPELGRDRTFRSVPGRRLGQEVVRKQPVGRVGTLLPTLQVSGYQPDRQRQAATLLVQVLPAALLRQGRHRQGVLEDPVAQMDCRQLLDDRIAQRRIQHEAAPRPWHHPGFGLVHGPAHPRGLAGRQTARRRSGGRRDLHRRPGEEQAPVRAVWECTVRRARPLWSGPTGGATGRSAPNGSRTPARGPCRASWPATAARDRRSLPMSTAPTGTCPVSGTGRSATTSATTFRYRPRQRHGFVLVAAQAQKPRHLPPLFRQAHGPLRFGVRGASEPERSRDATADAGAGPDYGRLAADISPEGDSVVKTGLAFQAFFRVGAARAFSTLAVFSQKLVNACSFVAIRAKHHRFGKHAQGSLQASTANVRHQVRLDSEILVRNFSTSSCSNSSSPALKDSIFPSARTILR